MKQHNISAAFQERIDRRWAPMLRGSAAMSLTPPGRRRVLESQHGARPPVLRGSAARTPPGGLWRKSTHATLFFNTNWVAHFFQHIGSLCNAHVLRGSASKGWACKGALPPTCSALARGHCRQLAPPSLLLLQHDHDCLPILDPSGIDEVRVVDLDTADRQNKVEEGGWHSGLPVNPPLHILPAACRAPKVQCL